MKKVIKQRITVWEYNDDGIVIGKTEVDAWCLPNETGFRAFYIEGDMLYEAYGDDGSWILKGCMHVRWLEDLKAVINSIEVENDC